MTKVSSPAPNPKLTLRPARIDWISSVECLPSPPTGSTPAIAVVSGWSRVLSSWPPSRLSMTEMRSRCRSVFLRLSLRPFENTILRTPSSGSTVSETTVPVGPNSV